MTRYEEYKFLTVILADLKRNYPEHNEGVLEEMLNIVRYRLERLEK